MPSESAGVLATEGVMVDANSTLDDATADAERFSLRCPCGHVLEGQRETIYQRLPCPECGEELFVLPRNPRPRPRPGKFPRNDPPAASSDPPTTPSGWVVPSLSWLSPRLLFVGAMATLRERLWRWRRRAAFAVFLVAVAGTLALAWRARQRDHYAALLNTATRDGRAALVAGDWNLAFELLRDADRAARSLGGDSRQQRLAKHLFREANIWYRLSIRPLHEVSELLTDGPDESSVRREFQRQFAGRTVIIDTLVSRDASWDEAGDAEHSNEEHLSPPLSIEWQLCDETTCVTLRVDRAASFDWIRSGDAERVMFGAELRDIRPLGEGHWEIALDGASCTLITQPEPLAELAWQTDEKLLALLTAQRQRAGIEP